MDASAIIATMTLFQRLVTIAICAMTLVAGASTSASCNLGNAGADVAAGQRPEATQASSATSEVIVPFSGEIVYEFSVFDTTGPERLLGRYELHYFISDNRWKHTDRDGRLVAQYEPSTRQIHFLVPSSRSFPASQADASYEFAHASDTRSILGYECKSVRRLSDTETALEFYTPNLRINPAPFSDHHFKGWAGFLKFTDGAISLDSEITLPGRRISVKTLRIERKTFDDSFWETQTAQVPSRSN